MKEKLKLRFKPSNVRNGFDRLNSIVLKILYDLNLRGIIFPPALLLLLPLLLFEEEKEEAKEEEEEKPFAGGETKNDYSFLCFFFISIFLELKEMYSL